jgi:hypothetical protein
MVNETAQEEALFFLFLGPMMRVVSRTWIGTHVVSCSYDSDLGCKGCRSRRRVIRRAQLSSQTCAFSSDDERVSDAKTIRIWGAHIDALVAGPFNGNSDSALMTR